MNILGVIGLVAPMILLLAVFLISRIRRD